MGVGMGEGSGLRVGGAGSASVPFIRSENAKGVKQHANEHLLGVALWFRHFSQGPCSSALAAHDQLEGES